MADNTQQNDLRQHYSIENYGNPYARMFPVQEPEKAHESETPVVQTDNTASDSQSMEQSSEQTELTPQPAAAAEKEPTPAHADFNYSIENYGDPYPSLIESDRVKYGGQADLLSLRFPALEKNINKARQAGFTDRQIEDRLDQKELEMSWKQPPEEIDKMFGRTDETKAHWDYQIKNERLKTIATLKGMTEDDVLKRIEEAKILKIDPGLFINNDELYKKLGGFIHEYSNGFEAMVAAAKLQNVANNYDHLTWNYMLDQVPDDQYLEQAKQYQEEIQKYQNGHTKGIIQEIAYQFGDLTAQGWLGAAEGAKYLPAYTGAAMAVGAASGPLAPVSAGAALATGYAASTAHGVFMNTMVREAASEFQTLMQMGLNKQTARGIAVAGGAWKAGIEMSLFSRVAKYIPGMPKFDKLMQLPAPVRETLSKLIKTNGIAPLIQLPTVKAALMRTGGEYLKDIASNTLEEMEQDGVDIISEAIARYITDNPQLTPKEAVERLWETGKLSSKQFALGMLPGAAARAGLTAAAVRSVERTPLYQRAKKLNEAVAQTGEKGADALNSLVFLPESTLSAYAGNDAAKLAELKGKLGVTEESKVADTDEVAIRSDKYKALADEDHAFADATGRQLRRGFAGKTMAEMAEQMQNQINDPLNADNPYAKSARSVRDTLTQELVDAGRDQDEAEAGATIAARALLARAERKSDHKEVTGEVIYNSKFLPENLFKTEVQKAEETGLNNTEAAGAAYGQAAENSSLYEQRLDRDEKKWSGFIDNLALTDSGTQTQMMDTPLVFTLVTTRDGNNVSRYPLYVGAGKLQKIQRDHPYMTNEVLKQIPRALADPIAIFRSSKKSKNPNGLVAMLELRVPVNKQGQEDTIIAALKLNTQKAHTDVDINVLASAYSKANERVNPIKPNPDWFAFQEKLHNLVYLNTKKSSVWSQTTGVQFPSVATIRNLSTHSIKTEADLVKLRKEYGNKYYQLQNSARRGQISIGPNGERMITLFKSADKSTFLHEMGHMMLEWIFEDGISDPNEETRHNYDVAVNYLGIADMDLAQRNHFNQAEQERLRQAHEKFARSFEAYLMTGKAPSVELRGLFSKVRQWMLNIYRDVTALHVNLSPEVQDLFDRMLATPDEIDASKRSIGELADEQQLIEQRLDDLGEEETPLPKVIRAIGDALNLDEKNHPGWTSQAQELNAWYSLDNKQQEARTKPELDVEVTEKNLPWLFYYLSPRNLKEYLTERSEKAQQGAESDLINETLSALDEIGKPETNADNQESGQTREYEQSGVGSQSEQQQNKVLNIVPGLNLDRVNWNRRSAGKEIYNLIRGLDPDKTISQQKAVKDAWALAQRMSRQAYAAGRADLRAKLSARKKQKEEVNSILKKIKRAAADKNVSWGIKQQITEKLKAYTLEHPRKTRLERAKEQRAYLDANPEADISEFSAADQRYINMLETTTLWDMTLDDLRNLGAEIEGMQKEGREQYQRWQAERDIRRQDSFDALMGELKAQQEKASDKPATITGSQDLGKEYKGVKGYLEKGRDWTYANTLGANRFFDWIGKGKGSFKSAWTKMFVDRVNDALDEELRYTFERRQTVELKMKELGLRMSDLNKVRTVDGEKLSVDTLLSIYAGLKNEKSKAAILHGNMRAWDSEGSPLSADEHAAHCVQALTANERALADAIMQDYDKSFDRLNQTYIAAFNEGMEKEENYTPMRRLEYTGSQDGIVDADVEKALMGQATQIGAYNAALEKGHLKNRQSITDENQQPIDLGLVSIWSDQVSAQEHTAAYGKLAGDLRSVLMKSDEDGNTLGKMVRQMFGRDAAAYLKEYSNVAIQGQNVTANAVMNSLASYFGGNMAITYLAGNLGTVLKQITSMPRFLITAGPSHLFAAIGQFLRNPNSFLEHVYELDPQMRNRAPNAFLKVMKDAAAKANVIKNWNEAIEIMMTPISYMDRIVSSIGWWATYQSNLKRGLSQADSIREAQRAVALTQQTPLAKDMPRLWNQNGLARLVMIFTSDAANTWGMTVYDLANSVKNGRPHPKLNTMAALALSAISMGLVTNGLPDGDSDDDWLKWFAEAFSEQQVTSIPVIGKEIMAALQELAGKGYSESTYSALSAPFVKIMKGLSMTLSDDAGKLYRDGSTKFDRGVRSALEGTSLLLLPFPYTAVNRVYRALTSDDELEAMRIMFGMRKRQKNMRGGR